MWINTTVKAYTSQSCACYINTMTRKGGNVDKDHITNKDKLTFNFSCNNSQKVKRHESIQTKGEANFVAIHNKLSHQ
jgi:hypothetical protein